jgi:hypothetical protein
MSKGEDHHNDFQTKKIWVVITSGKIYLFKRFADNSDLPHVVRFDSPCKVIVELVKSELHIIEKYDSFV